MEGNIYEILKDQTEKLDLLLSKVLEFEKTSTPQSKPDPESDDLVTPKEACQILGIAPSTLWKYKKQGRVKCYGISAKRFYKRSELIDSLTEVNS